MVAATRMLARNEGILLDPVYSGKGMAVDCQIQSGQITNDGDVIFLHTGGQSLFAYEEQFITKDKAG